MGDAKDIKIKPARGAKDLEATVVLFTAYARSLGIDLAFQDFEAELASLPGRYKLPGGEILLACDPSGEAIGCVAVRPMMPNGLC